MTYNLIIDVDGVMTTGQFLYSSEGKAYKIFGPHDSDGLKMIKDKMNILFITADKRGYLISKKRIEDMGYSIELVAEQDRHSYIKEKFGMGNTIFMGDGIFDAAILKECKFGIAPNNARIEAKEAADFITASNSAEGAVCDACIEIKRKFFDTHEDLITLQNGNLQVGIYEGNIVSIFKDGREYMHGGSKPEFLKTAEDQAGWDKSEIVMFPVIGPIKNYGVKFEERIIPLDQHGLTRCFPFHLAAKKADYIKLVQEYQSNTPIINAKYEFGKNRPQYLHWPFSYLLEKEIIVDAQEVKVIFSITNNTEKNMPYMFGWHPAFKIMGDKQLGIFEINEQTYTLGEVIKASQENMAMQVKGANVVTYTNKETNYGITVSSVGYGNAMLWCPSNGSSMFCIEPVTNLPLPEQSQEYLLSNQVETLLPLETKKYLVVIKPFKIEEKSNYKVCILAAGRGTRMDYFTKTFNKALIPIQSKPAICHIIEKFPENVEMVIALGYKKETVKDYLTITYPNRKLNFVEVDRYEGEGTGPGYSLLQCKEQLQAPFIFISTDTLVKEDIPIPEKNWFGVTEVPDTERFCSAKVENGKVVKIDDKIKSNNKYAFIGLAGVKDYETFFSALVCNHSLIGGEVQVSNGFTALIGKSFLAKAFTWFDTGTPTAYTYTLKNYPNGKGYQSQ